MAIKNPNDSHNYHDENHDEIEFYQIFCSYYVAEKLHPSRPCKGCNDTTRAGGSPLLPMRMHMVFLELNTTPKFLRKSFTNVW